MSLLRVVDYLMLYHFSHIHLHSRNFSLPYSTLTSLSTKWDIRIQKNTQWQCRVSLWHEYDVSILLQSPGYKIKSLQFKYITTCTDRTQSSRKRRKENQLFESQSVGKQVLSSRAWSMRLIFSPCVLSLGYVFINHKNNRGIWFA